MSKLFLFRVFFGMSLSMMPASACVDADFDEPVAEGCSSSSCTTTCISKHTTASVALLQAVLKSLATPEFNAKKSGTFAFGFSTPSFHFSALIREADVWQISETNGRVEAFRLLSESYSLTSLRA